MGHAQDRGTYGEQGAGFFFGPQGYFMVDGPSGAGGHASNARGFDGVAFNPRTDDLIIYDNKAYRANGNVASASAVDPARNLATNLDDMIAHLQGQRDIPRRIQIIDLLRQTRQSITTSGVAPPRNVRIAVTNSGGASTGISGGLSSRGLVFIDTNAAPKPPPPGARLYINQQTLANGASNGPGSPASVNARRGVVDGLAQVGVTFMQWGNDHALKLQIERELARLAPEIAETMVSKGGALVVMTITASSPPGVATVVARSVSGAYVAVLPPGLTREQAVDMVERQGSVTANLGPQVTKERRYIWYAVPTVR
jgi:hypothetical protein